RVTAGDAAGTILSLAHESDTTSSIAVDDARIYWWSKADRRIAGVDKCDPSTVHTFAARTNQVVSAIAVDASGVYWVELGPDGAGATTFRIMRQLPGGTPQVICASDSTLARLALGPFNVVSMQPGGVFECDKGDGGAQIHSVALNTAGITEDLTGKIFY